MQREQRPEGLALSSRPQSRSQSVSSDAPSHGRLPSLLSPPTTPNPPPAYIAAAVASQIVTSNCEAQADDWSIEGGFAGSGQMALVSAPSLKLVNSFLDQLLYNFLSVARSTSLTSLRPAVAEILRPTLAREAIACADQDLQQFLGGGEDEDAEWNYNSHDPSNPWDLELVWRRTRLRCMVYSSLGDVEEEAEDEYIEQAHFQGFAAGPSGLAIESAIVSRAVAIFLTSILEFIGEQTLAIAGQAAYYRQRSKRPDPETQDETEERIVVEELDTEKVALNATLGRLWRAWRKRLRSPMPSTSRAVSRDSIFRPRSSSGRYSMDHVEARAINQDYSRGVSLAEVPEEYIAANIPLPMSENDIDEIEIPGLIDLDDEQVHIIRTKLVRSTGRPRSLVVRRQDSGSEASDESAEDSPSDDKSLATPRAPLNRMRSNSLPPLEASPILTSAGSYTDDFAFVTPPESAKAAAESTHDGHESDVSSLSDEAGQIDTNEEAMISPVENGAAGASIPATVSKAVGDAPTDLAPTLSHRSTRSTSSGKHPKRALVDGEEPQILETTRVSLEGAIRPGAASRVSIDSSKRSGTPDSIVGRSRAASGARSVLFADTPQIQDQHISEEPGSHREDPSTIGLARTSDVSIQGFPTNASSEYSDDAASDDFADKIVPRPISYRSPAHRRLGSADASNKWQKNNPSQRVDTITSHPSDRTVTPIQDPSSVASTPASYRSTTEYGVSPTSSTRANRGIQEASPATSGHEAPRPDRSLASEISRAVVSPGTDVSTLDGSTQGRVRPASGARNGASRELPALNIAPAADRASVQRINSPTASSRDNPNTSRLRRSESLGQSQRPIHTSSSGTSQVSQKIKGLMGRQHDDLERVRTSDDGFGSASSGGQSPKVTKSSVKEQSFDELIQSDETIQYTLTPKTMREIESPESPKNASMGHRTQTSDLADFLKNTAPPGTAVSTASKGPQSSGPTSPVTGRRSTSTTQAGPGRTSGSSAANVKPVTSPLPSPAAPNQGRSRVPVARDARVEKESTKDIAEFLRSTGPIAEAPETPAVAPPQSALPNRLQRRSGAVPVANGGPPRSTPPPKTGEVTRSASSANRARLEARTPTVRQGNGNSELIEFLRQGPPSEVPQKTYPIRGPAQVRTEGSSTDNLAPMMSKPGGGLSPNSMDSVRNGSSVQSQAHSVNSSYNSQSALLGSQNRSRVDEPPQMQRKQRRVKDPYAIDTDSEDELEELVAKPKPKREEESLMDFLRNVPPPPQSSPAPITKTVAPKSSNPKLQQGRSNAQSLIARLGRGGSVQSFRPNGNKESPGSRQSSITPTTSATTRTGNGAPQLSLGPSENGGSLFPENSSLNPSSANGNIPRSATSSRSGTASSTPQPARPITKPATSRPGQVRSARADPGRSNDLAEFLKNSTPPETASRPPAVYQQPSSPARDESGFTKMFRRKKSTVGY
ncbi:MAG: hypothetical protein M4579_002704 [Chaenotheca gracillima]|nr:MAG: hypothetical protein M4579_002704 [Chaenotheca gracillima]